MTALGIGFALGAVAAPWSEASAQAPLPGRALGRINSPESRAKIDALVSDVAEHEAELEVVKRRSKLIRTKQDVFRIAVADQSVVEVVQFSPREIAIIGTETGTTTLTLWFGNQQVGGDVLSYLVTVTHDTAIDDQRRIEYAELERMINALFPNSKVRLVPVADKLIVRGQARDAEEATQIMSIIRGEAIDQNGGLIGPGVNGALVSQGVATTPFPAASDLPASNVISMLEVPGEMQVMLKVRIAELKRSAVRALGADFEVDSGNFFFSSILSGTSNIVSIFDDGEVSTFFTAFTSNGTMKVLAEPNLVTLSGHTASFIAGGEFAVPTVVGVAGAEAVSTQFRGFGTRLTFTPTVIDKDRIRLEVAPEFSALNAGNSVQGIPGLDTRAAFTTVDMREGQWLAIAGLLQDQQDGESVRVPLLGDIPLLGIAFSQKTLSRDESELIVLVSPELVHPMDAEEAPPLLPGTDVTEPDDIDFYLHGLLEGRQCCHHRSTVWPQYRFGLHEKKHCDDESCPNYGGEIVYPNAPVNHVDYARRERYYLQGAHGFSE
jgi:pilus assembly protein CpaC